MSVCVCPCVRNLRNLFVHSFCSFARFRAPTEATTNYKKNWVLLLAFMSFLDFIQVSRSFFSRLRAILIEEIYFTDLQISHKFLTWHDVSSKWKYRFLIETSYNLHNLPQSTSIQVTDEINENIFPLC